VEDFLFMATPRSADQPGGQIIAQDFAFCRNPCARRSLPGVRPVDASYNRNGTWTLEMPHEHGHFAVIHAADVLAPHTPHGGQKMARRIKVSIRPLLVAAIVTASAAAYPPPAAAQTQQTERVMRQKLAESQQLLAAVVTSDWAALDRHARALQGLTNQRGWDVMRAPEYREQTAAFQRAIQAVTDAAGERDQRTAVTAYTGLVASCVECHRYLARARLANGKYK
jgi:hypothetical protein